MPSTPLIPGRPRSVRMISGLSFSILDRAVSTLPKAAIHSKPTVPFIKAAGELKTKPTQQSVAKLREIGIAPHIIVCRCEKPLDKELQKKIAFPFVTVVMTLLAVPFGMTTGKRGTLYGIGIGIVIALTYWIAVGAFAAVGKAGLLSPVLAGWAPNVLAAGGAAYLMLTART